MLWVEESEMVEEEERGGCEEVNVQNEKRCVASEKMEGVGESEGGVEKQLECSSSEGGYR